MAKKLLIKLQVLFVFFSYFFSFFSFFHAACTYLHVIDIYRVTSAMSTSICMSVFFCRQRNGV